MTGEEKLDSLMEVIKTFVKSRRGPIYSKFHIPDLGVQVTLTGKRITIELAEIHKDATSNG